MTTHVTATGIGQDEDGWYRAVCACGWESAPVPDIETCADTLMLHAFRKGLEEGRQ